ncbi:cysteine hydrolase family protein [Chondromyces apiculatus]|uniref:nicotinamidase n=1 Tax=Chondromyces apiculatus DSM 436 TaxID=1192034 RepID=A0A017TF27_9BACT|nr:isochorismatase family protein [Chondromyces apiculatus]EYF07849.1 Nicotinamidase [Chondromyces apiculatus DSM 436]
MTISKVFIDVDVQRDFCEEEGSLCLKDSPNDLFRRLTAHAVAQRIPIVGSVDSHAWDAWEFTTNEVPAPAGAVKPHFPDHCVKGTPGWLKVEGTLPPRFRFLPNVPEASTQQALDELIRGQIQAVYFEKEVYSLFVNPLAEGFVRGLVEAAGTAPEFFVYGVATDYCVRAAALGLVERGYRTALIEDAVAGITPDGVKAALDELRRAGVRIAQSSELLGAPSV